MCALSVTEGTPDGAPLQLPPGPVVQRYTALLCSHPAGSPKAKPPPVRCTVAPVAGVALSTPVKVGSVT